MCRLRAGVGALALVWLGASGLQAANNPSGWIQTNGWNFLLPLTHNTGCGGGGADFMANTNWIAPHNIGSEDPKAGDIWDGSGAGSELIDFGGAAGTTGIVQGDLGLDAGSAVWASNAFLFDQFGVSFANGDVVDFNAIAQAYAASVCPLIACPTAIPNDNVLGIATTYVENLTGAPLVVQVCTASDDSIQVYINNCIVSNVSACRGTAGDCAETSTVALPAGMNKISVLVWEGGSGWSFRLALRNTAGALYTDANSAGVLSFIGAGTNQTGQTNECVAISRQAEGQPHNCPLDADDSATVAIKGVSAGDPGTMFHLEETINVFCQDALEISAVSDGGTVTTTTSPARTEPIITDLPESVHIGTDTGGTASVSGSGLGPYTIVDSSGADLWEGGDAFQFQYAEVTGDFDVAVEVLDTDHSSGIGRWGRYGLMARQIDEGEGAPAVETQTFSRYTMVNAKLPVWVEQVTVQARTLHNTPGAGTHFNNDILPDVLSARPRFMRLTRRGNTVQGWASNCMGLADGSADPYNDANWLAGSAHDYGAAAPAKLFVGFANGEHGSDGANTQTVEYRLLPAAPGGSKVRSTTITWDVTRAVLNDGLSYMMKYAGKETSRHALSVIGQNVLGIPSGINGVPFNNDQAPVGDFAFAHDIGGPRSPGSTTYDAPTDTYTITGAGDDVWAGGDQFQYAYNRVTGDFDMSMRVTERTHPQWDGRWGKHGLMARWTCDFNARYSFLHANLSTDRSVIDEPRLARRVQQFNTGYTQEQFVSPDGLLFTAENVARNACRAGCAADATGDACRADCDRAAFPTSRLPPWFRMIRRGDAIYTFLSEDDGGAPKEWIFIGSDSDPNMPDTILAGVAMNAHAGREIGSFKFDNFKLELLPPCPEGSCTATGDPLVEEDFENPADLGNFVVAQSGTFAPVIVGGRLQLTNQSTGSSGNAVWFPTDGLNLSAAGFVVEFDAFMTRTGLPGDANPADGMTFAVVQGNAAFASGLRGDGGGGLGYDGNKMRDQAENHPSFAVEMDNWIGGGEPGNEPSGTGSPDNDGKYHMGIDITGSVSSIQTNVQYTGTTDLPDIFAPEGIHVEVAYSSTGQIDVYVSANDGSSERTKVLSVCIPPLTGADLLLGWTAGTGGATATQEVDNASVSAICCEPTDTVTIVGDTTGTVGTPVELTTTTGGLGGAGTYTWAVVSGPGTVTNNNDGTATVNGTGAGDVVVRVTVDDGVCGGGGGGSDQHTITFEVIVLGGNQKPGDENQDGSFNIADPISVLDHLFRGTNPTLPCGDGTREDPANLTLLDSNGDGTVNIADPIHALAYLFLGGPPPAACAGDGACPCIKIVDCPETCVE